jgi:glycosyltransferase involved in cell wall biosynthesis
VLLFVGRLHPMKRPAHLIDAFVQAAPESGHLVVVGMEEGVTRHELTARVPAALRGQVHLVGPLAGRALAEAFLASDGFISLSHRENFGYSFAEALSYGLPAIVSPGHDLAHDLANDVAASGRGFPAGWCLGTDDLAEAVAAIESFSAAPESQLDALGAEGRRWAADHLSFERFRERVRALRP